MLENTKLVSMKNTMKKKKKEGRKIAFFLRY